MKPVDLPATKAATHWSEGGQYWPAAVRVSGHISPKWGLADQCSHSTISFFTSDPFQRISIHSCSLWSLCERAPTRPTEGSPIGAGAGGDDARERENLTAIFLFYSLQNLAVSVDARSSNY